MNISLTGELEHLVRERLLSGRYNSATDVVRDALLLIEERDAFLEWHTGEVDGAVRAGLASLRAGKSLDGEAYFTRLDAELEAVERDPRP
jgi:antitoxin ParD1/3/4